MTHQEQFTRGLRQAKHWGRAALGAVLPLRCLSCGALVGEGGQLCEACWPLVSFVAGPGCACCGTPFPHDMGAGALCARCSAKQPPYERARAALLYDDGSKGLLLGFKHGDRTDATPAFVQWMARAGQQLLTDCDLIAPVPLHWRRLFQRRYNQAALLAMGLGKVSHKPAVPDLLQRRKATPAQGHLSPAARQANVAGAFAVQPRHLAALQGQRVLLVDDVLTTGATVAACAKLLLAKGAAAVDVLTLALATRVSA